MQTIDNQLQVLDNALAIFQDAPNILKTNQERTQKAIAIGNAIIQAWADAWAIENDDERALALLTVDSRSNNFLQNCNKAIKEQKELRSAITQMMDEFKKFFTAAENEIDKAKPGTVPAIIQSKRDELAKEMAAIAERKRKEAERVAARAREAIEIAAAAETGIQAKYNDYLFLKKQALQNSFNGITLDTVALKSSQLSQYQPQLSNDVIITFSVPKPFALHTAEEVAEIYKTVLGRLILDMQANYVAELTILKDELCEKLPSKINELQRQKQIDDEIAAAKEEARKAAIARQAELEKANAEQRKVLEQQKLAEEARLKELADKQAAADADRKKREEAEALQLREEVEQKKAEAAQLADIKKQGEQTLVMFEQETANAEAAPQVSAKTGYDIEVTHQAGWVQIFQLWFENEGKQLPINKIGGTKLEQMKGWAEKYALKTGTKIESKFLVYHESYKAINR